MNQHLKSNLFSERSGFGHGRGSRGNRGSFRRERRGRLSDRDRTSGRVTVIDVIVDLLDGEMDCFFLNFSKPCLFASVMNKVSFLNLLSQLVKWD